MGVLLVSGILTADETLSVFSNGASIVISCMFVLSAALERTGVIDFLARIFTRMAGTTERRAALAQAALTLPLSALTNHMPVVVVFVPVVRALARSTEFESVASAYSAFLFLDLRRHDHTYWHFYEPACRWNCAAPGSRTIWDV